MPLLIMPRSIMPRSIMPRSIMPLLMTVILSFLLVACDAQQGNPRGLAAPQINAAENNPGGESLSLIHI